MDLLDMLGTCVGLRGTCVDFQCSMYFNDSDYMKSN